VGDVLGELLPLGLAIAASPFPVVPAILLLFTARPKAAGLGFLAGWVAGIVTATVAFVALATVVERGDEPPTWASWVRIVLGVALLVLGTRQWLRRTSQEEPPAWMRSIDDATPRTAVRLGVLLSAANPKVLLLAAAAGLVIGSAGLTTAGAVTATAVFTVVASSTVALPLLAYVVAGRRVLAPLGRARVWLQDNSAAVMAVVIWVIGALLVVKGVRGL
jgi:threonine/homoserine/homoserine lactone efflux protein